VKILRPTSHPSVTEEGAVCLSILRESYSPVMTLGHLIAGLQYLFNEPCPQSPLNTEASHLFQKDIRKFQEKVNEYIERYCLK
jgi:ubiquitin-protein ligase